MRVLRELKATDPAAAQEWARRAAAKPTGSGQDWSRVNLVLQDAPDDVKVMTQMWSEITRSHPQLSKLFKADTPVSFQDLPDEFKSILEVTSPEDWNRRMKKGLRLTLHDVGVGRFLFNDLSIQYNEAQQRVWDAWDQANRLTGPDKDRFIEETVRPLEQKLRVANSRIPLAYDAINATGTDVARQLASRRIMALTASPQAQSLMKVKESIRAALLPRFGKRVQELDDQVNQLMALWRNTDWLDRKQSIEWYKAFQKAHQFGKVDKFLQFFKAGLLGYPSRFANVSSNTAFVGGVRGMEDLLSAAMQHGWAKITGQKSERYAEDFLLNSSALRRAFSGGIGEWAREQKNAFALRPLSYGASKLRDMNEDLVRMPSAIGGPLGELVSFQFKGMNADDALFKHIVKVKHWYQSVYAKVKNGEAGFAPNAGETNFQATERLVGELEGSLKKFYDDNIPLDKRFADIIEAGQKKAERDTFQEELPGVVKSLQQSFYSGWGRTMQVPFPFVKTPWNIGREALRRTPLDLLSTIPNWNKMTNAQRADAVSRQAVSGMIAATLFTLTDPDTLSGSGPIDPEANMLKQQTGWRPYSIKIGDKWYSYQRLEPLSSIMGMVADAREGMALGDFDRFNTGMARAIGSVTENITNKTFLSGFENLVQATSDPIRYAEDWMKRTTASMVPNSIGFIPVGHLATTLDPVYRETEGLKDIIQSKIPGLSKRLSPQYNPAGGERRRPETVGPRFLSPFVASTERTGPEAQAASMMANINFPMRRVRSVIDYKGIKVRLTPEEQKALAKAQNDAMKFIGTRLMKDPNFLRLPDNEDMADYPGQRTKKDVLARIVRRYRNPIMAQLRPELRQRAATHLKEERASASGA